MAKKNKGDVNEGAGENEKKEDGVGSKLATFGIVLIIIIIWLAIFAMIIKMDFFGVGSLLRPLIKDVPYVNMILPDVDDETLIKENDYPYRNIDEAVEAIKDLEKQVADLKTKNKELNSKINDQGGEIGRLREFEKEQAEFKKRVERFDAGVVYNDKAPGIEEYKKYYEEINPETAERIYQQVVEQLQYDAAIEQKAKLLASMKPQVAADALSEMTADIEYTCKLLLAMKIDNATGIMNKMDTLFVARILQKMHDMDEDWYNEVSADFIP